MLFYHSEKLALFIDGANLYGAAKGLQFDIDYKRLLELFARKGNLVRAFYYTAVAEDQEFSPLRPLVDAVQRMGKLVSVVSTIRTSPPMVADELRRQADNFIELEDLRSQIAREGGKTSAPAFASA